MVTGAVPTARDVAGRRFRAARGVVAFLLVALIAALALAALRPAASPQRLDPASASQQGARALAQLLAQRGTPPSVRRSARDAAQHSTSDTVLVVTRTDRLTGADLDLLRTAPGDVLLVEPGQRVLTALAPGVEEARGAYRDAVEPGCAVPAAQLAGRVGFQSGATYTVPSGATGCYREEEAARLVQLPVGGRTVTVLGSGAPLTNEYLADQGNAALALNLIGARSAVVWLVPDLPAPGADDGDQGLLDLVPPGVTLFALQLVVAVVLVALWRGRRFGPVVTEPLPVVVRSAETAEGRARLYRAHHARGTAADALRAGTRARLMPLLGLPRSAADDPRFSVEVVAAVAARTTLDQGTAGFALYGPEPAGDAALVALSDLLNDLERQVRQS